MAESALKKVLKNASSKKGDFNFVEIDVAEDGIPALVDELSSLPIGYDRKTVVATNIVFDKAKGTRKKKVDSGLEPLIAWLAHPDPQIDLYMVSVGDIDRKHPLVEAIVKAGGAVSEVKEFTPEEWRHYIRTWLAKRGVGIEDSAIDEFSSRLEGDYARFLSEGAKLVAYKNYEGTVSRSDVEKMVHKPLEANAFALSDALFSKEPARAFDIYYDLKSSGIEPITLARMMLKQFSFLSEMSFLLTHGLNSDRAAEELGVHPYRAKVAARTISRLSKRDIDRGFKALHDFEKGVLTGEKEADIAFVECLSEIVK